MRTNKVQIRWNRGDGIIILYGSRLKSHNIYNHIEKKEAATL